MIWSVRFSTAPARERRLEDDQHTYTVEREIGSDVVYDVLVSLLAERAAARPLRPLRNAQEAECIWRVGPVH